MKKTKSKFRKLSEFKYNLSKLSICESWHKEDITNVDYIEQLFSDLEECYNCNNKHNYFSAGILKNKITDIIPVCSVKCNDEIDSSSGIKSVLLSKEDGYKLIREWFMYLIKSLIGNSFSEISFEESEIKELKKYIDTSYNESVIKDIIK